MFLEQFLNTFIYSVRGLVTSRTVYTGVCIISLGWQKRFYSPDGERRCNHSTLCNPVPTPALPDQFLLIRLHPLLWEANSHSGGLSESESKSDILELKQSLRAEMVSNFSLLLISLTEIRAALPYQEETLSLSTEYFPNDGLIWRYAFHTSQTGGTYISVHCRQLSVKPQMQLPQNCKHSGL